MIHTQMFSIFMLSLLSSLCLHFILLSVIFSVSLLIPPPTLRQPQKPELAKAIWDSMTEDIPKISVQFVLDVALFFREYHGRWVLPTKRYAQFM